MLKAISIGSRRVGAQVKRMRSDGRDWTGEGDLANNDGEEEPLARNLIGDIRVGKMSMKEGRWVRDLTGALGHVTAMRFMGLRVRTEGLSRGTSRG